jgi:hypothetical protein
MSEWQDISTAPKNKDVIDIWSELYGRCTDMIRRDYGSGNVFYEPWISGHSCVRDATHWMPLPNPPANRGDV